MIKIVSVLSFLVASFALINGEIFFHENFKNEFDGWVFPTSTSKTYGKLNRVELPGAPSVHYGVETTQAAHHYAAVKKLNSDISAVDKDIGYIMGLKASSSKGCGGNYIKILPTIEDPSSFHADSPYNIMFGPDKCGSKSVIHVIINYNNVNHELTTPIQHSFTDYYQIFRLNLYKDKTFKVYVDDKEVRSGSLITDFTMVPPKQIKDPNASKPENWDDKLQIDDPNDSKPADWDKPEFIPDQNAKKPDDWNDEDGEWIPDNINNPEFKGEWKPKKMNNPNYQGVWEHPMIDNPSYNPQVEKVVGHFTHSLIAIDWWEVESGDVVSDFAIGTVESINLLASELVEEAKILKSHQDEQKKKQEEEEKTIENDPKEDEPKEDDSKIEDQKDDEL